MADANYRGVSAEQDGRYRNKETLLLKKLAKDGQFPKHFDEKVDMSKVNLEVMRPWIAERVEQLLGFEDDVVVEYASSLLDGSLDPRKMQLSLTGFLEKSTPTFMSELWTLLLSAQKSIGGIPQEFVDKKKEEMRLARERDAQAIASSGASRRQEPQREPYRRQERMQERSRWQPGPRDSGYGPRRGDVAREQEERHARDDRNRDERRDGRDTRYHDERDSRESRSERRRSPDYGRYDRDRSPVYRRDEHSRSPVRRRDEGDRSSRRRHDERDRDTKDDIDRRRDTRRSRWDEQGPRDGKRSP